MEYVDVQGAHIPQLGLGTWQMTGRACSDAVREAVARGYRHIDTAQMYENEGDVGIGLRESQVPRDELWITTKLGRGNLKRAAVQETTQESIKRLGADYIDLLLIHWPSEEVSLEETLDAMQQLVQSKHVRHLGVSNFTPLLLKEALAQAPLITNQVEYHPYLSQDQLIAACRASDIALTAYCPLAKGRILEEPTMRTIAARYERSAAQVALRWLIQQKNVVAIPKAGQVAHMSENLDVFDFELALEDERAVNQLLHTRHRIIDPDWAPEWDS